MKHNETSVIVDANHNENELVLLLEERGLTVSRASLKTGDVAISNGNKTILVERKTVADLASGIDFPSRFIKSQRIRLVSEMENPNTIAIVLVHGVRPPFDDSRIGYGKITGQVFHSVIQTTQLPPYSLPSAPNPTWANAQVPPRPNP